MGPRFVGEEKAAWVALIGVVHTLVAQVYSAGVLLAVCFCLSLHKLTRGAKGRPSCQSRLQELIKHG